MESVNKEIKRRTEARQGVHDLGVVSAPSTLPDAVGISTNEAAILRLAGAVLLEVHDEGAIVEQLYLSEGWTSGLPPKGQWLLGDRHRVPAVRTQEDGLPDGPRS